ncbi:MAG TPA: CHAD domain-containing protein [Nitrosopumilaceae archaeon]|nr:CHAD domain-containing protein [Nitrosopumilaceae archaeon]
MVEFQILTNKVYIKNFQKIVKKIIDKLEDYLDDPNEENIHDSRITIRRLETAYRILPKKIRKQQKFQNYIDKSSMLFKLNTEIRDFDIITSKLDQQHFANPSSSKLVSSLMIKRKTKIRDAHIIAAKLRAFPVPKIIEKQLSESKLKKRFRKTIRKLNAKIKQNMPIVISDDKKIDELHKLRKDFKKLRYTVELSLRNKKIPVHIENLKKIQDILGEIHDSDIMLDYLKNQKLTNEITEIIKQESIERNLKYKLFVKTISEQRVGFEKLMC